MILLQANCHSSNFGNSAWVDNYINVICQIRGGDLFDKDKVLIKSIINKIDDYKFDRSTVEKLFRKIANASLSVAFNQKLMKILAELEKPVKTYNIGPIQGVECFPGPTVPRSEKTARLYQSHAIRDRYNRMQDLPVGQEIDHMKPFNTAKHVHHAVDFGLNPMTYDDLKNIAKNGLINHALKGGSLPNEDFIQDFQMVCKVFAEDKNTECRDNQIVFGQNCKVCKNNNNHRFVYFDSKTGEGTPGYELSESQSENHDKTGIIGQNYPNSKN